MSFVVKQSLLDSWLLGAVLREAKAIAVSREDPRKDLRTVLTEGAACLARGRCVCVFPQTTRMRTFDPERFNSLGVKLAKRAGVPVLPVALRTDLWACGKIVKDLGRVYPERPVMFHFGEPIATEGNPKEVHARVLEFMQKNLTRMGVEQVSQTSGYTGA